MLRSFTTFGMLLVLAAWAGAQGKPVLSTADQLRMLQTDRSLLGTLLDDGLSLATAESTVAKADGCRRMTRTLVDALGRAAGDNDADRTVELGEHLEAVIRDALAPTLDEARGLIPDDSPEGRKLKQIRAKSVEDVNTAVAAIPDTGKVGDHARVRQTRDRLEMLKDRLK